MNVSEVFDEVVVSNILKFLYVYHAAELRIVCRKFYDTYYTMYPDNDQLSLCGMKFRLGHIYYLNTTNKVVKVTDDLVFAVVDNNEVYAYPIVKEDSIFFSEDTILVPTKEGETMSVCTYKLKWIYGKKIVRNDDYDSRFNYIIMLGNNGPLDNYVIGTIRTVCINVHGIIHHLFYDKIGYNRRHNCVRSSFNRFDNSTVIIDPETVKRLIKSYYPQMFMTGRGAIIYEEHTCSIRK